MFAAATGLSETGCFEYLFEFKDKIKRINSNNLSDNPLYWLEQTNKETTAKIYSVRQNLDQKANWLLSLSETLLIVDILILLFFIQTENSL